jgi:hypothetical protein
MSNTSNYSNDLLLLNNNITNIGKIDLDDDIKKELTSKEINYLDSLNKISNESSKNDIVDLKDKSLNNILNEWSRSMSGIFYDLSVKIDISKYIATSDNFYDFFIKLINNLWIIISVDNRLIYVGFTIILVVMLFIIIDEK